MELSISTILFLLGIALLIGYAVYQAFKKHEPSTTETEKATEEETEE